MTSREKWRGGGTLPSTGMWQGEVFAISDCLVIYASDKVLYFKIFHTLKIYSERRNPGLTEP